MKTRVGDRLPIFSKEEKEELLYSSDFFGLNHYTTAFASDVPQGIEIATEVYGSRGIFED